MYFIKITNQNPSKSENGLADWVKSLISQSIMKEMKYLSRIADKTLDLRLEAVVDGQPRLMK